jgi:hypothetical protein
MGTVTVIVNVVVRIIIVLQAVSVTSLALAFVDVIGSMFLVGFSLALTSDVTFLSLALTCALIGSLLVASLTSPLSFP